MPVTEYQHHRIGVIQAVKASDWQGEMRSASADWVAATADYPPENGHGKLLGYVVDTRADAGGLPSPEMPADDDARPFDSFDRHGRYITCTHSLRGALLAIGNRA